MHELMRGERDGGAGRGPAVGGGLAQLLGTAGPAGGAPRETRGQVEAGSGAGKGSFPTWTPGKGAEAPEGGRKEGGAGRGPGLTR